MSAGPSTSVSTGIPALKALDTTASHYTQVGMVRRHMCDELGLAALARALTELVHDKHRHKHADEQQERRNEKGRRRRPACAH